MDWGRMLNADLSAELHHSHSRSVSWLYFATAAAAYGLRLPSHLGENLREPDMPAQGSSESQWWIMTVPGYKNGDRVRFSAKGKRHYEKPNRVGVVTNQAKKQSHWLAVKWDGNSTDERFHPAFIEKVNE
jgi:1,4-alpha-glucan branching enzyme